MATPTHELIGSPHPSISVILPILNEEAHLKRAIDSILSQDYLGKTEVILAVGPSHDRTLEIAQQISQQDSRVVIVDNPTGRTAAGLNLALKKSQSPVIVRVDGHAQIPSNYLSLVVEILNKTGAVNVGGVMAAVGTTAFALAFFGFSWTVAGTGSSSETGRVSAATFLPLVPFLGTAVTLSSSDSSLLFLVIKNDTNLTQ